MSTKSALQSKTIIGILIAALPTIANHLGYNIDAVGIEENITTIVESVGVILAIYGRLSASDKIVGIIPKKERKPATYSDMRTVVAKKRGRPPKKR
jgi:hypothetical protein